MSFDPSSDYPLGSRRPDLVTTPGDIPLDEVTLDALRTERLGADEMRATPETLTRQAAVAIASGRRQLAENLERAAELANVPAEVILEIYTALRPRRSTAEDLEHWAERLEGEYEAPRTATFVREAKAVYLERGLLEPARQLHEQAGAETL
jgi:propanediol dehydratase small subunit